MEKRKVEIITRDFKLNPSCNHGPSVLFCVSLKNKKKNYYFACSAFRSRKLCPFYKSIHFKNDQEDFSGLSQKHIFSSLPLKDDDDDGTKEKEIPKKKRRIENNKKPSELLTPMAINKGNAQFFFNSETSEFLKSLFSDFQLLCIGAGKLFENTLKDTSSFLLDIDSRFSDFYTKDQFAQYNMANHHFFEEESKKSYKKFMKKCKNLIVFVDPPFGMRFELLAYVFDLITQDFKNEDKKRRNINYVIISPYFMEGHIKRDFLNYNFQMSDYRITYENHKKFKIKAKKGKTDNLENSPIRLFTTLNLSDLKLPTENDIYKYCKICQKYVHSSNQHCEFCDICTTKNGPTYNHCFKCSKCIKPTWTHCNKCNSCFGGSKEDHKCYINTTNNNKNIKSIQK